MKKLFAILALSVTMIMGGQAMAQTRGALLLSGAFPLKDYADFDGFNDFALISHELDDDDAGAGIGFNVGFKWYFNVGVKGLGVMLSVDGIYNGPNADLKKAYNNTEFALGNLANAKFTSTPKFINVPIMLGLNYIYHFNPNFGLYVEAGAGGNMRFITDMVYSSESVIGSSESTHHYDMGFSFAYQVGAGFEVARNLVIGCSFYDLGNKAVKGSINDNMFDFGTVHPMMVMARIGFCF